MIFALIMFSASMGALYYTFDYLFGDPDPRL